MALEVQNIPEYGASGPRRTPKSSLGKDDFLLLLTKQLQNQDPMKPMENTEFVSQLASFSSLEQMSNMNQSLSTFITKTDESYKMQAMNLLGTTVTANLSDSEEGSEPFQGLVTAVRFVDGEAIFKVGDKAVRMSEIQQVEYPTA